MMSHKVVLVTGGGGSIGSALVLSILRQERLPKKVVVLDISEYNLYSVKSQIDELGLGVMVGVEYLLVDIRHTWVMDSVFKEYKPDIVFHAAALKHVPLLESQHNAIEAIRTNVLGTQVVYDCSAVWHVETLVVISTDKAVNPVSMMGATKTFAEGYCKEMAKLGDIPCVVIVRFGNVIGSSGSVIPLFQHQIERGGPVTVTHPNMWRYFMSIEEAVNLVVDASMLGTGVYILDMGEEKSILDIALQLIAKSGRDISVVYTGIRPGEKLREELTYDYERKIPVANLPIYMVEGGAEVEGYALRIPKLKFFTEYRELDKALELIKQKVCYSGGCHES